METAIIYTTSVTANKTSMNCYRLITVVLLDSICTAPVPRRIHWKQAYLGISKSMHLLCVQGEAARTIAIDSHSDYRPALFLSAACIRKVDQCSSRKEDDLDWWPKFTDDNSRSAGIANSRFNQSPLDNIDKLVVTKKWTNDRIRSYHLILNI